MKCKCGCDKNHHPNGEGKCIFSRMYDTITPRDGCDCTGFKEWVMFPAAKKADDDKKKAYKAVLKYPHNLRGPLEQIDALLKNLAEDVIAESGIDVDRKAVIRELVNEMLNDSVLNK